MPKEVAAQEATGPAVHKVRFVVLQLLVERSHLICVLLLACLLGGTHSSMEGESAVLRDERC